MKYWIGWENPSKVDKLDRYWKKHLYRRQLAYRILRELRGEVYTVLDVGCGTGVDYPFFRSLGWRYVGCDLASQMLKKIRSKYQAPVIGRGDLCSLPFRSQSFDLVYSSAVLCHLPEDLLDPAMMELLRVAKKYLVLAIPYVIDEATRVEVRNGFIVRFFNLFHLLSFLKSYAEIQHVEREDDILVAVMTPR